MVAPTWKKVILGISGLILGAALLIAVYSYRREEYPVHSAPHSSRSNSPPDQGVPLKQIVLNTKKAHQKMSSDLPFNVIQGVKTFVFFIGYPRSGHSIVGSMMDAHPSMIIAHEFLLFKKWKLKEDELAVNGTPNTFRRKSFLFNAIYKDSQEDLNKWRHETQDQKGYSLDIDYPWQGMYDKDLLVLGDKSGGVTTFLYMTYPEQFKEMYTQLETTIKMPIKVIHVVRNPFDLSSTAMLYAVGKEKYGRRRGEFVAKKKALAEGGEGKKYGNEEVLELKVNSLLKQATAVSEMIEYIGNENVLEIHNSELVFDPKDTLQSICKFLELECPEDYVEACAKKAFDKVSKTREVVKWPPRLREQMETIVKQFPFFERYSFDSDY